MSNQKHGLSCLALFCLLLTGCGGSGVPMAKVDGVVTVNGKPVSSGILVFFDPVTGDGASVPLNESGQFSVAGNVRVGSYTVAFQPPPLPPPLEMAPGRVARPRLEVPMKYQSTDTSDVKVEVKEGDNQLTVDFRI